jgi:hypothetical protein
MTNLDPQADKTVRDAVDAFMEGRLNPEFVGETVFETKNSRYRLLDGVVVAAPVETLIGAELVGWLVETTHRSVVGSAWQPGARAVLVDRHRGRNIIVTSTTRLLHLEPPPSDAGRMVPPPPPRAPGLGWSPPSPPARILPATPFPQASVLPRQSAAVQSAAVAVAPPASYAGQAGLGPQRAAAVHLPPRPMAPANPVHRPLPLPAPPPRREPFTGLTPPSHPHHVEPSAPVLPEEEPAESAGWDLTSAEYELEGETVSLDEPSANALYYDATRQVTSDSVEIPADELTGGPESGSDAPILLVRPRR